MLEARGWLIAAFAAAVLATPTLARAQPAAPATEAERAEADALFADGRALLERGRYREACDKLSESERLSPAVGTLLNLGYCWEQLGRFRSAMDAYAEAGELADDAGDRKRAALARARFTAVSPRAPRVLLRVAEPLARGIEVRQGGELVPPDDWGKAIPVDPVDIDFVATAPGKVAWRAVVRVRGEGAVTTVVVPPLPDPVADGTSSISTVLGPQRVAAIALGSGALAAFGSGAALAFSASARRRDARHHCVPGGCDEIGQSIRDRASSQGNLATALFAAGLISLGAGTWLWLTSADGAGVARIKARTFAFPGGGGIEGTF